MNMDITIGILTWNSKDLLKGCLDSIYNNPISAVFEVIVIDNCSEDDSKAMVKRDYPQARLIENSRNLGVAPGRNQIIGASRGRYIMFLDVDTLVLPGAVDTFVACMGKDPSVAIGGPRLVYEDGSLQLSCRPFPKISNIVMEGTSLRGYFSNSRFVKDYTMEDWDHKDARDVDWLYGACLVIRKDRIEEIGVFDERFFYLYEDIDICWRAKKLGMRVRYFPEATIVHFLRRERKKFFHPKIRSHIKSIGLYLLKDYYGLIR
ncbi:MAG: glycosyltransferase family 2 protein [Deltaproteobacteria bacterium]|nr:glycosyltransferase family 2 protein [Deltaproteobacteria bacterium]